MRLFILQLLILSTILVHGQTVHTVGPGQQYLSIQEAYDNIPNVLIGSHEIHLMAGYTTAYDSLPLTFGPKVGANANRTITLLPQVSGIELFPDSFPWRETIVFDSCSYVIIDGRVGGVGDTANMIIRNAVHGKSAIVFDSAHHNVVRYCNIQGANYTENHPSTIQFNGYGCENNVIEHCLIQGSETRFPRKFINADELSNGNTLSNNYIFDCGETMVTLNDCDDWLIEGNHIYQTIDSLQFDFLESTGYGTNVVGNYFGGSAPYNSGAPYKGGRFVLGNNDINVSQNVFSNWSVDTIALPFGSVFRIIRANTANDNAFYDIELENVGIRLIEAFDECSNNTFHDLYLNKIDYIYFIETGLADGNVIGDPNGVESIVMDMRDELTQLNIIDAEEATNNVIAGIDVRLANGVSSVGGSDELRFDCITANRSINNTIGSETVVNSIRIAADIDSKFYGSKLSNIANNILISNVNQAQGVSGFQTRFFGIESDTITNCVAKNLRSGGNTVVMEGHVKVQNCLLDSIDCNYGLHIGIKGRRVSDCELTRLYSNYDLHCVVLTAGSWARDNLIHANYAEGELDGIRSSGGIDAVYDNVLTDLHGKELVIGVRVDGANRVDNNTFTQFYSLGPNGGSRAIDVDNLSITKIRNNLYQDIHATGGIVGIYTGGASNLIDTIANNTLTDLYAPAVYGISCYTGNVEDELALVVMDNVIQNFTSPDTLVPLVGHVGIWSQKEVYGAEMLVKNNLIQGFASNGLDVDVIGIHNPRWAHNNIVRLGVSANGDASLNKARLIGIQNWRGGEILYNSIYLKSTYDSLVTTACIMEEEASIFNNPLTVYGNILSNTCTNSPIGTGTHYTYLSDHNNDQDIDYNIHFANGTGAAIPFNDGWTDYLTLADVQSAFSGHQHSLETDPMYMNPNGPTVDADMSLNLGSAGFGAGITQTQITEDYFHLPRSATPTIGAIEGLYVPCAQIVNATSCTPYTSPSGNYTWNQSGTYLDTIPDPNGCDQLYQVNFVLTDEVVENIAASECMEYVSPSGSYTWTVSGTYNDTIFNQFGCDSIFVVDLQILQPTSSSIQIYACDSAISPSGNYVWSVSGIYTDVMPNAAGCDSTITVDFEVVDVNTTVTIDGTNLISNATGASYQWLDCNNNMLQVTSATNASLSNLLFGTYAVEVTQHGCVDTSACFVIGDVGIEDGTDQHIISCYPNPTNDQVALQFQKTFTGTLKIFDAIGSMVHSQSLNSTILTIVHLSGQSGIYQIQLIGTDGTVTTLRVIKE